MSCRLFDNQWGTAYHSEELLRYVSLNLANESEITYNTLNSGQEIPGYEGLRENELDLALVNQEQKLVTQFINEYFQANPELDRNNIIAEISYKFNPESLWFFSNKGDVKNAIYEEFISNGITLDMSNEDHRIRLGHNLVNKVNAERGQL